MLARIGARAMALIWLPALLGAQQMSRSDLERDLKALSQGEHIADLPPVDSIAPGGKTISAGTISRGTIVAQGPIDVFGQVDGSVVSLSGNVHVHAGGIVTGDALAVDGRVIADSGRVDGEMRSSPSLPVSFGSAVIAADTRSGTQQSIDAARLVVGSFAILLVIAVGVVIFAGPNLAEVVQTIEGQFARAFWYGLAGQLVALPALLVLVVALALSLIGILLIPFAIVAYAIAVAGLITLGFLATARLVGGGLYKAGNSSRVATLYPLAIGVTMFFALWMVAALLAWAPLAASVIRAAALAATWVAGTLGLGAALLSRAGTHRKMAAGRRPLELASWQTPTPVTGVVAARRTAGSREARQ